MKKRMGWLSAVAVIALLAGLLAVGRKRRQRPVSGDPTSTVVVAVATPVPRRITATVQPISAGIEGTDRPIPALAFAGDLHREVCACSDLPCLDAVNQKYRALAGRQAPVTAADETAYLDVARSTRPCVQRILDAEASGHNN